MTVTVTTKIYRTTRDNLQILSRITGEDQVVIMDRAILDEMKKPENQKVARQFIDAKVNGKPAKKVRNAR